MERDHLKVKVVHLGNMHYHHLASALLAFGEIILSSSKLFASGVGMVVGEALELE
jgi:hypothetical protein